MSGIEVIIDDLSSHPLCAHGPTLLFSRVVNDCRKKFFACAACRDRKDCNFFLWENEAAKVQQSKKDDWEQRRKKYVYGINHRNLFLTFNEIKKLPPHERTYCNDCSSFQLIKYKLKHKDHSLVENISDYLLKTPSELLKPLDNAKLEAQYLFSKVAIETIVNILKESKLSNVLCIGAPRIHEYISKNCADMSSLLLDIDKRYLNFFGPLEFCWYNSFNHHFFLSDSKDVFEEFIQNNDGKDLVIVTDPPFGGRVEPLADTFKKINMLQRKLNKSKKDVPIFWTFPYFMEPLILNSLPEFHMLDYKVDYDNHPLFSDGPKGRKQGSPVRIFTNLNPSVITLPADQGYKHCKKCNRWVYLDNKHCNTCKNCTSKDGRTYVHCHKCKRCVKPTWTHCEKCQKCGQPDHKCDENSELEKECFHCKQRGHKKRECPNINHDDLKRKRKSGGKFKPRKIKSS